MNLKKLNNYEVIEKKALDDIHAVGYLLEHKKTGARVTAIEADDENKVFGIGFRTPPEDSTGLPHILEHSVLCGSKNFPTKDPFVELVKGSLNTFLNAMTYPDKTVYPVASCNDKDFQNLMHVYLDAVFYPNIYKHEEIFRQEGWSYQIESEEGELAYNGVVYNEMKGAFSSPESVLDRVILNSLFPDTSYANESGGDPDHIPELSYEQFLNFHRTYYHPSNSFIYLYGDMNMEEKLVWIDEEYLSGFEKKQVDSAIRFQEPFREIRRLEIPYSISKEESERENTFLSHSKVIGTNLDHELYVAFQILDYALLSAPGAPLMKNLTEAGIGKDIMGGYDNSTYQPIFSIIAKNADPEQEEAFLHVVYETLEDIVKNGMDHKAIEAGINYNEFRFREADFGSYPKGLMYGLNCLDSWLYDEKAPFMHLEILGTFQMLREKIGTGYFEELIQKYLLDNKHGSTVIVKPEKGRTAKLEEKLRRELAKKKEELGAASVRRLVEETQHLREFQSAPERDCDLEKIPLLSRSDIRRQIQPTLNEEMKFSNTPAVFHEVDTNGIGYLTLMFDLSDVSFSMLPYVGILQSVLGIIDTDHFEYGELFNEINLHTGGIGTSIDLYSDVTHPEKKEFKAVFEIKGKALYGKLDKMFEMIEEILMHSRLDDGKRIKEILDMSKSRLLMRFQSSGHVTAAMRALSYASPAAEFKEMTGGIDYYRVVSELLERYDEKKEELFENLIVLCKTIFDPENMMISYTAEREGLEKIDERMARLEEHLKDYKADEKGSGEKEPCVVFCEKKNEGFITASKIQYVARAGNFIDRGIPYTGALQILKVILSYDYLWQKVRVQGGAYGCMSNFTRMGEGHFCSYRDPNLRETNEVFEGVTEYLQNFSVSERDMTKYIIGTMSNVDHPLTPSGKGERSMNLYLSKVSEAQLQKERDQILDATQEDIRALSEVTKAVLAAGQFCVIGNEEKIEEEKELFKEVTQF